MEFLISFVVVVVASFALRNPLRKAPAAFYGLAIATVVLYFAAPGLALPHDASIVLLFAMQRCFVPVALFVLVMYIGVLPYGSSLRRWLQPVRGPLSVVACILVFGHMAHYFAGYLPRMFGLGSVASNVVVSFVVASLLFVLLLVLGVTSLEIVKRRMKASLWKRIQRLAYLFYALTYLHLMAMLLPSALAGGTQALVSMGIYTVVFGCYAIARVVIALKGLGTTLETAASEIAARKAEEEMPPLGDEEAVLV
ncbi:ferric reductase-like transmembrane domain-containing protein [Adlercreutzia equolifaciens]|uniref:ferric reductase-like transmembrane domain-containing protein n=1 Tax=Adlercreutzia equolifaciens TaxID=446660 RepID=UPI0023AF288B|nr:ferric reductase-like transmembrane domain-containing protein [Adlercreutzia equolifaciens]MDE8701844.1 ferric reductase-like transmembrane domain-containing protein [Adlercreutzia equolifaciens]